MRKEDLLQLAAFIITDGGIFRRNINKYLCESLKKDENQKFFCKSGSWYSRSLFSFKKLVQQLHSIIGNSKKINIKEVKKLPKSQIKRILQILFSTDGGVSFSKSKGKDGKERLHRKITFTAKKNPENLKIVQKLLALFGIKSRIHSFDLEIKGKENLKKFKEKIGFIDGVKITGKSKKWKGIEKNRLLEIVLNSFRDTRGE
jgi:hypothetical protein